MEKPRRSHFDGVIHDPADLQKPIVRIEIQKEAFLDLRKFFFTSALIVLLIDAGVIGISSFIHARTAKADTIFYPATCLGGWTNPNNAEGKPDVSDPTQLTNFSDTNSAVLSSDTGGEIYCGGFTGEVPPDTLPRTLTISFSMAAKQSAAPASPNEDTTLPPGIVSALEGTTTPNSGIPSSDETTPHASSSDEVTVPSSPSQNAPVDGSSTQASSSSGSVLPLPENMDSSSQGSQTFFWFGDTAYAADDSIASSSATSPAA
ncbi:MAG: hypothetical protein JO026_01835, partial [Patescibacteria group bacterium]|nr:hypothetical protein [Patescibacteria group bacterium]